MIVDLNRHGSNALRDADVCIIGAGAAGITLAAQLSKSNLRCLLLEAGGVEPQPEVQDVFRGSVTGTAIENVEDYTYRFRLRFLGGSTNHWAGWCRELDDLDFQEREWVNDSGWPISKKDLDPYYEGAYDICDLHQGRGLEEKISGVEEDFFEGDEFCTKFFVFSPPTRFKSKFGPLLLQSRNIRLVLNAYVTDIRSDPNEETVQSLEIQDHSRKRYGVRARAYVLAAGGLENPRLMLISNSVNPKGLANSRDCVGRYYMDHPHAEIASGYLTRNVLAKMSDYDFDQDFPREQARGEAFRGIFAPTVEAMKKHELMNTSFEFGFKQFKREAEFDSSFTLMGEFQNKKPFLQPVEIHIKSEQEPNPKARVMLADEEDGWGKRRIRLHLDYTDLDRSSIERSIRLFARQFSASGLGRIKELYNSERFWEEDFKLWGHPSGTTRMSSDPAKGVVDGNCKVHGLDNLYVAGSSIFATSGSANPTINIVAFSLRLAEHLKGRIERLNRG